MASKGVLCVFVFLCAAQLVTSWSGNYYKVRDEPHYASRRECSCWFWLLFIPICIHHRTINYVSYWTPVYTCCQGWTHNGNEICNLPVCSPTCKLGGTCQGASPSNCRSSTGSCSCDTNTCNCPSGRTGKDCGDTTCSHLAPCYPGDCINTNGCQCAGGFRTNSSQLKEHCLSIDYSNRNVDLKIYTMQVRMSYWTRDGNQSMEKYRLLTDSTHLEEMDFLWTNQRDFNRLETTCSSQFFANDLPPKPDYIGKTVMGVVSAQTDVHLSKRPIYPATDRFYSLNGTVPCPIPVIPLKPGVYECNITIPNFDRLLEHGDFLKVTYRTSGGGFRELIDLNTERAVENQTFTGSSKELSVEFRFDFQPPYHCAEKNCSNGKDILNVPDITKASPLTIFWNGWTDDDSKMYRYAMEVFKMTKTADGGLEIKPSEALNPLHISEVFQSNLTAQLYTPPEPGMYSIILEAADLANNTKYVRRLCLYDPTSVITNDPVHDFYVMSASQAANYSYQSNSSADIVVTWDRHFRNAFHEENNLLGAVRPYPPSLENHKKYIPTSTALEDHQGEVTVRGIPHERGIVKFHVYFTTDHNGGLHQPDNPPKPWQDVGLNTTMTLPTRPGEGDTVTIWVKATDVMGNERLERIKVTLDSTPPDVAKDPVFLMNVRVPGIDFSSKFQLNASDDVSGIAFVKWTFTRRNGSTVYQEIVPGQRSSKEECTDIEKCKCTPTMDCFWFDQSYSLSNCHMMVEKENLATEVINVTVDVTNMAGVTTRKKMQTGNLTMLNGTEAYFPPQNVRFISITDSGVTLTWDFPPSCFRRLELSVIVNDKVLAVHKDATQFDLSGLDSKTTYTIYMQVKYDGDIWSDKQPLTFTTVQTPISAGTIAGLVIGLLLLVLLVSFIVIFVLWRRGRILQRPSPLNRQLRRVDGAIKSVHRMTTVGVRRMTMSMRRPERQRLNVSNERDEIYMYGEMTFGSRQPWQLDAATLTLVDHLIEGKFANIYRARWLRDGKNDAVVVKMPKPGFTQEDALKMTAKINFFATKFDDHENVIRFLGAVIDNTAWGPAMVMEYCDKGQLDKWLAAHKENVQEQLMDDLMHFSLGVAKGMEYLATKAITHRRLAARNVLLSAHLDVRVAGFGPEEREGIEQARVKVPVKWAAPEVLRSEPPTEKSDVWSYGVVLWEIFSLGEVPYPSLHSNELGTRLKGGYRMTKPELTDDLHYCLMKECWEYKPTKRPTFKTIRARLEQHFSPCNRQSIDFYYETFQLGQTAADIEPTPIP